MSTPEIHKALVDRLVGDVPPVRPLRSRRVFASWAVLQAAVLTALVAHRLRPDVGAILQWPLFVAQVLALMTSGTLAAWLAARAAFPDRPAGPLSVAGVAGLAISGLMPLVMTPAESADSFVATGLPCFMMTITVATAPWLALLILVGRGASVAPTRAGLLAGAAAFLLAAAGMRVACSVDGPSHLLVWHGAPVVLGAAVSALLGAALLGRWMAPRSFARHP